MIDKETIQHSSNAVVEVHHIYTAFKNEKKPYCIVGYNLIE